MYKTMTNQIIKLVLHKSVIKGIILLNLTTHKIGGYVVGRGKRFVFNIFCEVKSKHGWSKGLLVAKLAPTRFLRLISIKFSLFS